MVISGDFTPMITQTHEQLRDKRERCAGLRPGGPRCRTWLADNLHFGSINTDALPLCGPIPGVQNCMCDWARSQAGATAATHRPTCRLGRALTLRFVTLAVRSLSRSTEWCSWSSVAARSECHVRRLISADPWQREGTNLCMLVFSAVFCCSYHGNVRVPAWAPLGLFSSALLFMPWHKECQLGNLLVFSAEFCCS